MCLSENAKLQQDLSIGNSLITSLKGRHLKETLESPKVISYCPPGDLPKHLLRTGPITSKLVLCLILQ